MEAPLVRPNKTQTRVGTDVVAHLEDPLHVVLVGRRNQLGHTRRCLIRILRRQALHRIRPDRARSHGDARSLQRFDEDRARVVRGLHDPESADERKLPGQRRHKIDRKSSRDFTDARLQADATRQLRLDAEIKGCPGGPRHQRRADAEGRRLGPPIDRRGLVDPLRINDDVHHVVVDEGRPDIELSAEVERLEQSIVNDYLARNSLDPCCGDLRSQRVVTRQRVRFGQLRVPQRVRLVVIQVGNGEGAVGVGAATHRQIAACDQDEIAGEDSRRINLTPSMHRSPERMRRGERLERQANRKELPN